MSERITVYISIGNSDDKLTQKRWAEYIDDVDIAVEGAGRDGRVHGRWHSAPKSPFQNACWCVEFDPAAELVTRFGQQHSRLEWFRQRLQDLARKYGQESIAWAVAETEFIAPTGSGRQG